MGNTTRRRMSRDQWRVHGNYLRYMRHDRAYRTDRNFRSCCLLLARPVHNLLPALGTFAETRTKFVSEICVQASGSHRPQGRHAVYRYLRRDCLGSRLRLPDDLRREHHIDPDSASEIIIDICRELGFAAPKGDYRHLGAVAAVRDLRANHPNSSGRFDCQKRTSLSPGPWRSAWLQ